MSRSVSCVVRDDAGPIGLHIIVGPQRIVGGERSGLTSLRACSSCSFTSNGTLLPAGSSAEIGCSSDLKSITGGEPEPGAP